jgi:hypothetical protein
MFPYRPTTYYKVDIPFTIRINQGWSTRSNLFEPKSGLVLNISYYLHNYNIKWIQT